VMKTTEARKATRNGFWGIGEQGTLYLPISDRLRHALLAAGVNANAQLLLFELYAFARIAQYKNQPLNANGEMRIYPLQSTLAKALIVTAKTVQNHLSVLERAGAIRRQRARGSANVMYVLAPGRLFSSLVSDDGVRANLKAMHPRAYRELSSDSQLVVSSSSDNNDEFQ
jgi:hypothetical protein